MSLKKTQLNQSVTVLTTSPLFIKFISDVFVRDKYPLYFQIMFMTRNLQFPFYKPMELFTINAFIITVMKCTSEHLQIDGDVAIFPKVSRAACHRFIWVRVRIGVGIDYTHQTVNHMTDFCWTGVWDSHSNHWILLASVQNAE